MYLFKSSKTLPNASSPFGAEHEDEILEVRSYSTKKIGIDISYKHLKITQQIHNVVAATLLLRCVFAEN